MTASIGTGLSLVTKNGRRCELFPAKCGRSGKRVQRRAFLTRGVSRFVRTRFLDLVRVAIRVGAQKSANLAI